MADFKVTKVADTPKHVTYQAIWTATTTEDQDATVFIDLSAQEGSSNPNAPDLDSLNIEEVHGSVALEVHGFTNNNPTQRVFLLDGSNDVLLALDNDFSGKLRFPAGGLRGTKELNANANGDLRIGCGGSIAANGTATAPLPAGSSYSIMVKCRKIYADS